MRLASEIAGVLCVAELRDDQERARQKREHYRAQSRPPVDYASVAQYLFLPVPVYISAQAHE